jgi:ribosomal-protein-alanine N-acetyltransferase
MASSQHKQEVEFKLARMRDAQQIACLSRDLVEQGLRWSWTPKRVAAHIRNPESNVLTAWIEEQLAGFAIMQFHDEHAHLNLLAVDPSWRRFGIGRQLLEWLEETALVGGIFTITLEVRAGNAGARTFYRALGYQAIDSLPGYYGGRETAIRMARDLRRRSSSRPG